MLTSIGDDVQLCVYQEVYIKENAISSGISGHAFALPAGRAVLKGLWQDTSPVRMTVVPDFFGTVLKVPPQLLRRYDVIRELHTALESRAFREPETSFRCVLDSRRDHPIIGPMRSSIGIPFCPYLKFQPVAVEAVGSIYWRQSTALVIIGFSDPILRR